MKKRLVSLLLTLALLVLPTLLIMRAFVHAAKRRVLNA